jgi:uncharacterized protein YdhG (YjbR/CyaY superfamily)
MGSYEPRDIDEYIAGYPPEIQALLQRIRATIREAAPQAEETIKYKMPTFMLKGNLVHFAAYKKFISLYPAPRGSDEFNEALAYYRAEKSTLRFALDEPIPYGLIAEIVRFRVKENLQKAEKKKSKKSGSTEEK